MNALLYMALYMRVPPNYTPPSDFVMPENGLGDTLLGLAHLRAIVHSSAVLASYVYSISVLIEQCYLTIVCLG